VITRLDALEYVPSQAATPAQQNTAAATQNLRPRSTTHPQPPAGRPTQDRPAQPRELVTTGPGKATPDDPPAPAIGCRRRLNVHEGPAHSGLRLGSHFDRLNRDVDGHITYDREAVGLRIIRVRQVIFTGRR
jgi:hypothetical protein